MNRKRVGMLLLSMLLALQTIFGPVAVTLHADGESQHLSVQTENRATAIKISEFYAGSSKSDSKDLLYRNDFVELFNPTSSAVNLDTWSLQYAAAQTSVWEVVYLEGEIPAHGFYLIALKDNTGTNATVLPNPDVSDVSVDLHHNQGKLALMSTTTAIGDLQPTLDNMLDFVCYGADNAFLANECSYGDKAEEAGQKNTMQRRIFNPLNPESGLKASDYPTYGNDWHTGNNGADFKKDKPGHPSASNKVAEPRAYAVGNQVVSMQNATIPSADSHNIVVELMHGFAKPTPQSGVDFQLNGLPAGLQVSAVASEQQMVLTVSGVATEPVVEDIPLTLTLLSAIWDQTRQPASARPQVEVQSGDYHIMLQAAADATVITLQSEPVADLQWAASRTMLEAGRNTITLQLEDLTPQAGELAPGSIEIEGLPAGLQATAVGLADTGTIQISIQGTASTMNWVERELSLVLHPAAVVESGWRSSKPIRVQIKPYIDETEQRQATLKSIIQQSNDFYMNPFMKQYKYSEQTQGANAFNMYRGNPEIFYADLGTARMPLSANWEDLQSLRTWIEGDAHLQNVGVINNGVFAQTDFARKGQAVFELNDFDSAYIAPFYLDLLRMIPSLYMERDLAPALSEMSMVSDAEMRVIATQLTMNYYDAIAQIVDGSYTLDDSLTLDKIQQGFTRKILEKSEGFARQDNLDDETQEDGQGGRIFKLSKRQGNKYWVLSEEARAAFELAWQSYVDRMTDNFPLEIAQSPDYFKIKDVVYRINQGNASIGSKRYNVLIEGPSADWEDDILLDVKEAFMPDMFGITQMGLVDSATYSTQYGDNHALRAVEAYRAMTVNPEPFVGVLDLEDQSFMVKAIAVGKNDYADFIKGGSFQKKADFSDYIRDTATAFALAHARAARHEQVNDVNFAQRVKQELEQLGVANFAADLAAIGENYYLQANADFLALQDNLRSGRLIDVRHLTGLHVEEADGSTIQLAPAFSTMYPYPAYSQAWPHLYTDMTLQEASDEVIVEAVAADAEATVSIAGQVAEKGASTRTVAVEAQQGTIEIVVTARDGSIMTYVLDYNKPDQHTSKPDLDELAVNEALKVLAIGYMPKDAQHRVTSNLTLPSKGAAGTTITWKTDHPAIKIDGETGVVTRPSAAEQDVRVTLTAQISKGAQTREKVFVVTVLRRVADPQTPPVKPDKDEDKGEDETSEPESEPESVKETPKEKTPTTSSSTETKEADDAGEKDDKAAQEEAAVPTSVKQISDIAKHWAEADIVRALQLGWVVGYEDDQFKPDQPMTRIEFISLLARVLRWEKPERESRDLFSDQADIASWGREAIEMALALGMISGYEDGSFRPRQTMTRAEIALVLAKGLALPEVAYTKGQFADEHLFPTWAKSAIAATHAAGLMNGREVGKFEPTSVATRAEVIVIFMRALQAGHNIK